jgi:hypothetical protein
LCILGSKVQGSKVQRLENCRNLKFKIGEFRDSGIQELHKAMAKGMTQRFKNLSRAGFCAGRSP